MGWTCGQSGLRVPKATPTIGWGLLGVMLTSSISPAALPPSSAVPSAVPPAGFVLKFTQDRYFVGINDLVLEVSLVITPVPREGVVSYGVSLGFDPSVFRVDPGSLHVPPELDFNGIVGPGALREVGPGYAAIKGTVDLLTANLVRYDASLIAVFGLVPLRREIGLSGSLSLDLYRTLGPGESVFVGGDGSVYDSQLSFGTATFTFVPEPSATHLFGLGIGALLGTSRRSRGAISVFRQTVARDHGHSSSRVTGKEPGTPA